VARLRPRWRPHRRDLRGAEPRRHPGPGNYDGTDRAEPAVIRPSTGQWFVFGPRGGRPLATFGATGLADIPVPGDYDGVGHAEPAVFRPTTSQWFVLGPGGGHLAKDSSGRFGAPNLADVPLEGQAAVLERLGKLGGIRGKSVPQGPAAPRAAVRPAVPPLWTPRPAMTPGKESDPVVVMGPADPLRDLAPLPGGRSRAARAAWLTALERLDEELRERPGRG
jgi:hypothetical protein